MGILPSKEFYQGYTTLNAMNEIDHFFVIFSAKIMVEQWTQLKGSLTNICICKLFRYVYLYINFLSLCRIMFFMINKSVRSDRYKKYFLGMINLNFLGKGHWGNIFGGIYVLSINIWYLQKQTESSLIDLWDLAELLIVKNSNVWLRNANAKYTRNMKFSAVAFDFHLLITITWTWFPSPGLI